MDYNKIPLNIGLKFAPDMSNKPEWMAFQAPMYTERLREILRDTLGRLSWEGINIAEVSLHPRYWCGKSLLPLSKCSANVRAILATKDWDAIRNGQGYISHLSDTIEALLNQFIDKGLKGKHTVTNVRILFSGIYHLLRRYLRISAKIRYQRACDRLETFEEDMGNVKRYAEPTQQYWYKARRYLKSILVIQRELAGYGLVLSQVQCDKFLPFYECPPELPEFEQYDPEHSGLALCEIDMI